MYFKHHHEIERLFCEAFIHKLIPIDEMKTFLLVDMCGIQHFYLLCDLSIQNTYVAGM